MSAASDEKERANNARWYGKAQTDKERLAEEDARFAEPFPVITRASFYPPTDFDQDLVDKQRAESEAE